MVSLLASALLLGACAQNTGVGALYGDVLMVAHQGATGASSATAVRYETMAEAQAHCTGQRREMYLVELIENKPPFLLGNFPRSEVRFMCLEPDDPRLTRQQN